MKPCRIHPGHNGGDHYARTPHGEGPRRLVHRKVYEDTHGQIPPGFVVHHACERKGCVEESHLVAMTVAAHISHHRAGKPGHRKDRCKRGHQDWIRNGRNGSRACRACRRQRGQG